MFCSECGRQATGKYCRHCGTALGDLPPDVLPVDDSQCDDSEVVLVPAFDWEQSLDYGAIVKTPEVASRIAQATAEAERGVSGQKLLTLLDQAATPLTGGVSSIAIAKIAQPLSAKLGLKSGKQRCESISLPPGRVLANIGVGLARAGCVEVDAEPAPEECQLTAIVPADLRSMEGKLSLCVARQAQLTRLSAEVQIEGAWYDWGKCNRQLEHLFASAKKAA